VKQAFLEIDRLKSPGPDAILAAFFINSSRLLHQFNHTFTTLIAKNTTWNHLGTLQL